MTNLARKLSSAFDYRYRAGLMLLAVLATLTFFLTFRLTSMEETRAEFVSIASNQRALSQRIAFLANAYVDSDSAAEKVLLSEGIQRNVRAMERSHYILTLRIDADHSTRYFAEPLQEIYFSGSTPFDEQVRNFLEDGRLIASSDDPAAATAALTRVNAAGTNYMMQTHDLITRVLEYEAAESIAAMERAEMLLWAVTILFLVLEGLFIFRPMSKRIARSVDDVEKAEAQSARLAYEAQQANTARTRFFRSASHELRTPLNAILGLASVLKDRDATGDHARELRQLELAGDHLLHLVDNMLEMNRLGREHIALKPATANLAQDIADISDIYGDDAVAGHNEFTSAIDPAANALFVYDTQRLRQVLGNLVTSLYARPETGTVKLAVMPVDGAEAGKTRFHFAISHTGIAAERIDLGMLEEHGHEVHGLKADTAYAISIARNIVTCMGGSLAVRDASGHQGCELVFMLDLDRAAEEPEETVSLTGRSILVVDDNVPNQMVASTFLQAEGVGTVLAANGQEAVDIAGQQAFDLILMDISMPVMDGVEATRHIRSGQGPNAKTPIVALTAHVQQEEIGGLIDAGMVEVLHKPIKKEVLIKTVASHLYPDGRKDKSDHRRTA